MKARAIQTSESVGRVLYSGVRRPDGSRLFASGRVLKEADVLLLQREGLQQLWVAELEEGEVGEEQAVSSVSSAIGVGSCEVRLVHGGRADLIATEHSCVLVDEDLLRTVNATSSLVFASVRNFSLALSGEKIARAKAAPVAVSAADVENILAILRARGPILRALPIRAPSVAVLYCDPQNGDRARTLFEPILTPKLRRFGVRADSMLSVLENEEHIARGLQQLLSANPSCLLVASTSAPAGPEDAVGVAMSRIGCVIEKFLAPVEPGVLLLMAYRGGIPILAAPGCFRLSGPSVVDLLLPPMLAGYRVSGWELACLGHGGLLA